MKTREQKPTASETSLDALAFLEAEHRAIQRLFTTFRKTDDGDLEAKSTLVQRSCEEITIHTIIEEELLYPAAQEALPESTKVDVEEAYVEHYLVKTLIAKFETLKADDKGFDATFKVMSEMVDHHIEEEEGKLFPELRRSKCDLQALGEKMAKREAELQAKLDAVGSKAVGDNTALLF